MSVYEASITNPKKQLEFYKQLSEQLQQENQELKKQLHNASIQIQEMVEQDIECPSNCSKLEELENQQKEFIEYLENEIKKLEENDIYEPLQRMALATHQHNLSKYKEITGQQSDTQSGQV